MQRLLYLFIVSIVVAGCKQDVAYQSYVELYNLRKQGKEEVKIVRKSIDYIIDNIEGKHSLIDGGLSVAFDKYMDSLECIYSNDRVTDFWQYTPPIVDEDIGIQRQVFDIDAIAANDIIADIYVALDIWENTNSGMYKKYDIFDEYILPYRIDHEPLDIGWRINAYKTYCEYVDYNTDIVEQCITLNKHIPFKIYTAFRNTAKRSYTQYAASLRGTCDDQCLYTAMVMRAVGIPVAYDIIPHWGSNNLGHSLNALLLPDGTCMGFNYTKDLENGLKLAYKVPKIYRKTYSIQKKTPLYRNKDKEYIPTIFSDFTMLDVTADYDVPNADIKINNRFSIGNNRLGYLAVADRTAWNITAWGVKKGKSYHFENVGYDYNAAQSSIDKGDNIGSGILYLPVIVDELGMYPMNYPFILSSDGIQYLKPAMDSLETVRLYRKYPKLDRIISFAKDLELCVIEGANTPNFSDAEVVYTITKVPESHMQKIEVRSDKKYKYVRILKRSGGFSIGELAFYGTDGRKLNGRIISHRVLKDEYALQNIFDNNVLSYFYCSGSFRNLWVGLAFTTPQQLDQIALCPRTDDNDISPGDTYELLYWNNEWISLGCKTANEYSLIYDHVPSGALLLLKNHTKGIEERPFIYRNGRQIWY